MACYPPHVSKVVSYPTDFVGNAALKKQGAVDWQSGSSHKLQRFWDESVLRIKKQVLSVQVQYKQVQVGTVSAPSWYMHKRINELTGKQLAYLDFLDSDFWKELRAKCLKRDGERCRKCKSTKHLQAHHHTYPADWYQSKLAHLITLCDLCHKIEHGLAEQKPLKKVKTKGPFHLEYSDLDMERMTHSEIKRLRDFKRISRTTFLRAQDYLYNWKRHKPATTQTRLIYNFHTGRLE